MSVRASWESELAAAEATARQAGAILQDWAGRFRVHSKGPGDLVTDADHAAQAAIQSSLVRQFPEDGFLGEEEGGHREGRSARRWIVDPLDGTTNYVHGLPFYAVSIGLESEGQLTVGVVYDPVRKECFSAAAGMGVCCNGVPIQVSGSATLGEALVSAQIPINSAEVPGVARSIETIGKKTRSIRRLGSAALILAYIAAGRLDAYWGWVLKPWDVAAGVLLVTEAGGQVTHIDQSPFNVYTPDILATNGLIHAVLAEEIALPSVKRVQ